MVEKAATQAALEHEMAVESRERAVRMMNNMEDAGRAHQNPYAMAVFRRWVMPLRGYIEEAVKPTGKAGRHAAHIALIRPLEAGAIAYIAVRSVLTGVLNPSVGNGSCARQLGRTIGKAVYGELVLSTFKEVEPDLFWEIAHDLDRKNSKSSDHRYRTMRHSAAAAEVQIPVWTPSEREQVGSWVLESLRLLDMIDIHREYESGAGKKGGKTRFRVLLTEAALKVVNDIRSMVELTMPMHVPFIEPPRHWTGLSDGGYHTPEMQRLMPVCINMCRAGKHALIDEVRKTDLSNLFSTLNAMQDTRWKVNRWVLDTVRDLARHGIDMDEIIAHAELPRPPKPEWLSSGMKKEEMDADQLGEFAKWKHLMAEWHTQMKLRGSRWGRFYMATRMADKFKNYEVIYFLYQADFRGRMYAITTGLSPQGSDLQKALIHFADGEPLATPEAVRWFKIHGANKFGIDKVPFEDRIKWVHDNEQHILQFANDPVSYRGWTEADSPVQFLAWCREYAEYRSAPATFVSRIPVGFDGSCNGLQHFSAMLRDTVGGRATNLLDGTRPEDIYQRVADVTLAKLNDLKIDQLSERDRIFRRKWIAHGINRSLVKRSVMTLPYGSTQRSCSEFIVDDYLNHKKATEFEQPEYHSAAHFLSTYVWAAIGEVVIAASGAMAWLQKCAGMILKNGRQQIRWNSPSGFPVVQVYNEVETVHVRSLLMGGCRITVGMTGDEASPRRHKNGLSPNFVHSMDAAHLTFTTLAAKRDGINSLAMIHDDYGTHASKAQRLYEIIRETFVEMYEKHNPIRDFCNRYDGLPTPPPAGELDIREVLKSKFFFA